MAGPFFALHPAPVRALARPDAYEVAPFATWLSHKMTDLGLPDTGIGFLDDVQLVGLAFVFLLLSYVAALSAMLARQGDARSVGLRSGALAMMVAGLTGVLLYRIRLAHPTLGDQTCLFAAFASAGLLGLAAAHGVKTLVLEAGARWRRDPIARRQIARAIGRRSFAYRR